MKGKMFMLALLVSVALAGQGFAAGLMGGGGCNTCGHADASCSEPTCCDTGSKSCDLFAGLKGLFASKKCYDPCCEPSPLACEPVCYAPEPASCAPDPCFKPSCKKGLLDGLFACKKKCGQHDGCDPCGEPAYEPICGDPCGDPCGKKKCGKKGLLSGLFAGKKKCGQHDCGDPCGEIACEPICSDPCQPPSCYEPECCDPCGDPCGKKKCGKGLLGLLDDLFACKKKCNSHHPHVSHTGCGSCGVVTGGGAAAAAASAAPAKAPAAAPIEEAAPLPAAPAPKADPQASLMGSRRIYQASVIRN